MLPVDTIEDFSSERVLPFAVAAERIAALKAQGKTVGLCHGGYDLLHPGHVKHFESAKQLCDVLIVSLTADKFIAGRKGAGRPIFNEQLRAYMAAAIRHVDYTVISDFKGGVEVIEGLRPSFYIKGPDFVGKTTPGITAEREAIARVGGEMRYTTDTKLGTTEIIDYIKHELDVKHLLVVLDRDGTLITNDDFFGKEHDWEQTLELNKPVIDFLIHLKTKYKCTFIVATNQTGVARRFFTTETVEAINRRVGEELRKRAIAVADWQYCPDADKRYADAHPDYGFDPRYVKETTKRKPDAAMVSDSLAKLGKKIGEFSQIVVVGNGKDDEGLAKSLGAGYIDVTGKSYEELTVFLETSR